MKKEKIRDIRKVIEDTLKPEYLRAKENLPSEFESNQASED